MENVNNEDNMANLWYHFNNKSRKISENSLLMCLKVMRINGWVFVIMGKLERLWESYLETVQ